MCNSAAIHFNVTAVSVRSQWAILIFHTSPWRAGLFDAQRTGLVSLLPSYPKTPDPKPQTLKGHSLF